MNKKRIVHVTSVHPRYDTRIFYKNCISLSHGGYNVSLIVADGLGDEVTDSVNIIDIGKRSKNRLLRYTTTAKKMLQKAKEIDADVYHFHDPELIPVGLKLKKVGKKVIFDIHENVALQIKSKSYIFQPLRKPISMMYRSFELLMVDKFDALVLAEDSYMQYYQSANKKCLTVLNMPDISILSRHLVSDRNEIIENEVFYLGGITKDRGFDAILDTMEILKNKDFKVKTNLVGRYSEQHSQAITGRQLEDFVKLHGYMNMVEGYQLSKKAKVGISILSPIENYLNSYSTKIFEYMAVGLPVITSNFELYRNVIEKHSCGICVNPEEPEEIAEAIEYIINNPKTAKEMGQNGIRIVNQIYNWDVEKSKLLNLYKGLLS